MARDIRITFFNTRTVYGLNDLVTEGLEITSDMCTDTEEFKFGAYVIGGCKLTMLYPTKHNINKGEKFRVDYRDDEEDYWASLGVYYVDKINISPDKHKCEVVGYDEMYKLLYTDVTDWCNNYEFPVNLLKFTRDFIRTFIPNYSIIPGDTFYHIHDKLLINPAFPNTVNACDILSKICELTGYFVSFRKDGYKIYSDLEEEETLYFLCTSSTENVLENKTLPNSSTYPYNTNFSADGNSSVHHIGSSGIFTENAGYITLTPSDYASFVYANYNTVSYNNVKIYTDNNVYQYSDTDMNHCYIIKGNYLLQNLPSGQDSIIKQLLAYIKSLLNYNTAPYTPFQIDCLGQYGTYVSEHYISNVPPNIQAGYGIAVKLLDGKWLSSVILHSKLTGIYNLRASYSSEGIEETTDIPETTQERLNNIETKTDNTDRVLKIAMKALEKGNETYNAMRANLYNLIETIYVQNVWISELDVAAGGGIITPNPDVSAQMEEYKYLLTPVDWKEDL